jgi:Ca-activated chloride channel family protein
MSGLGHRRRISDLTMGLLAFCLLAIPSSLSGRTRGELDPEHREWLERVALLILPEEREYFLSIDEPFRRDAFIESFWQVRDPDTETARNEFRRSWDERVDLALEEYGSVTDARAVMLLFNGEPGRFRLPDGRVVARCFRPREEVEVWFYGGSLRTNRTFVAILYAPDFPPESEHRIWLNRETMKPAQRFKLPVTNPSLFCDDATWGWAIRTITDMGWDIYRNLIEDLISVPKPDSEEWIATFNARSTLLPEGAETFEAVVEFDFPGRNQNRVAVRGVVSMPAATLSAQRIKGQEVHEVLVTGEVVRDDRLFEQFRYRYEVPVAPQAARIPIVFQRYLRPGSFRVLLKVEDLIGRRFALFDGEVRVPEPDDLESVRSVPDTELFRKLEEARQAAARGQTTIRILPPPPRDIMVGALRVNTVSSGEFDKVTFFLDGEPLLTKKRPPFSVELNLGEVAASHRLRVAAFGAEGNEVASDEMLINQGGQRFRIRLIQPRADRSYAASLSAVVQAEIPDGKELERIEVFLDEQRVATLYQPPFEQAVLLERQGLAYVRAVGFLADGSSTEDVVFINAPDYFEQLEVQFVELYATVIGKDGGQRLDLSREDFTVFEDGEPQEIRRFEYVRDLPIHVALLIDTSASMEEALPQVADAARAFLEEAVEPRDRVTLIGFDSRPRVETRFTNEVSELSGALAKLRPGGGTAIFDSLVFALHYFDGVKGAKALLLLSDGKDESSHFDLDGALAVAHRVGVTVYVIGMRELSRDKTARRLLRRIAQETGGQSFFIEDPGELPAIYEAIQEDLRSQYLIAYQSTSGKDPAQLRLVRVEVGERGAEVRTLSGYYP